MRLPWSSVPREVVGAVEAVCGAAVVGAVDVVGGFSPGTASLLSLSGGARAFAKVVPTDLNAHSTALLRDEAVVMRRLADVLPEPRLLGAVEAAGWTGLVLSAVDGRSPSLPWRDDELALCLSALQEVGRLAAPPGLPDAETALADQFSGWRVLAADPPAALDDWSRAHLDELAAREPEWVEAVRGDRLVHGDPRADNLLVAPGRAVLVDWPAACAADPLLDAVLLAPSVALQGGPSCDELVARLHPGADRDRLHALVRAFAGYLVQRSLQPDPPGLPTLRAFQAGQGRAATGWLRALGPASG